MNKVTPAIAHDHMLLAGIQCQEASPLSREKFIACGAPATSVIWHDRDRRAYPMCSPCADHNARNRGGRLLVTTDAGIVR